MIEYFIPAAFVIGGGIGAILGRVTSGAAKLRHLCDNVLELNDKFIAQNRRLVKRINEYQAAEAKRQAQRKAAAIKAGERSHRDRLAREAEAAAKTTALHETMRNERADVRELIA